MKTQNSLPTLSVVVPVYNEEKQLSACLEALAEQLAVIQEIIIVDNNSSDNSATIAQDFQAKHASFVRLMNQPAQGLVPTRNLGFLEAQADIVARIDADTQVMPGWAEAIRHYFLEHPKISALYGQTSYHDIPFEKLTTAISSFVVDICNRLSSGSPSLYGPNMAIRTPVAKELAVTACTIAHIMEDLDLTIHLQKKSLKIGYCKTMSVYISGRRLASWPIHYWRYCVMWPRTYKLHHMHGATAVSWVAAVVGCFFQMLIFLPLRSFDVKTRRFSWRVLMKAQEDRIIP